MQAHPHLDVVEQLSRIVGWPALASAVAWGVTKWVKGQGRFKAIYENTKDTKAVVTRIEDNHLEHLQAGITEIAKSNDEAVKTLQEISTNIKILVDRTPRG